MNKVGMYVVQTDHPGLMPGIKKKKITKKERSQFVDDTDASTDHIVGTVNSNGIIIKKIEERLDKLNA